MPVIHFTDRALRYLRVERRTDFFDEKQKTFGIRISPTGAKNWFVLYTLIFGFAPANPVVGRRALEILMAAGLLLYIGVGLDGILEGGRFLDYGALDKHDPVHGQHVGILLIELGVGITVAATMVAIFFSFAARGRS